MTTTLLLLIALALLIAWTVRSVRHDERGHRPPPSSHRVDTSFISPTRLG